MTLAVIHGIIPINLENARSSDRLNLLAFIPQMCKFRKQIDLNLLDFNQPLPLARQEVVDFVVQLPDFKFGF